MELDVCFFGRSLRLLQYFMCANSEGSGETAQMLAHVRFLYSVFVLGTLALELQHTRIMNSSSDMKRSGSRKQQLELPKGLTLQHLQKRPSIAPVPAVIQDSNISITVQNEDTMSEDSFPFMDDDEDPG